MWSRRRTRERPAAPRVRAAYERARGRRGGAPAALAVVTPLPPSQTGIAAYSLRLLDAVAQHRAVHVYADGLDGAPVAFRSDRLRVHEIDELRADAAPWQRLFCFGKSPFHVGAWQQLQALGGDVLLHEATLWGLYHGLDARGLLGPGGLAARVRALDGCTFEEAIEARCAMVGEVVARARRILVHTETARSLLLERHPDADVAVVSFALPPPTPQPPPAGEPVVASFGHQRAAALVVDAFAAIVEAVPSARLTLVGAEHWPGQFDQLRDELRPRGLDERATFTGWVDDAEYRRRIAATTVAVQPRTFSYGERSAALGDLLCAGVPTVVNDASHAEGVPRDALAFAEAATAAELANAAIALLRDAPRRERVRAAALGYAASQGASHAAAELLAAIAA